MAIFSQSKNKENYFNVQTLAESVFLLRKKIGGKLNGD
nr:MAG TPA: hypothetical protein [Bacteriophage sp.]